MMKKNISQCMIVKNEEKNIRRALSWGKDIMCEQIVADTGSSDRTVEIAREMGAKIFFFPWIMAAFFKDIIRKLREPAAHPGAPGPPCRTIARNGDRPYSRTMSIFFIFIGFFSLVRCCPL